MNTDIQKRAEELYPKLKHDFFSSNTQEDIKYYQREGFIKGYSEGYEKGREEMSEDRDFYKNRFESFVDDRDTLQQRVKELERDVKEIEEDWFTRGCESIKEEVERIEGNYAELKAENEQLRKDVTEFAEWVSDPECYWMNDGIVWYLKLNSGGYERKTTSELYELFKVRK
jgi:chromosome segregation ATPase